MGRVKNGILGTFSGKVGAVVGVVMRGKNYVRGLPEKSSKPATLKQIAARAKFRYFNEWRNPFSTFFAITFFNQTATHSAQNAVHRFNKDVVIGEYPDFDLDYRKIKISEGTLALPENFQLQLSDQTLLFTWKKLPSDYPNMKIDDLLAFAVFKKNDKMDIAASTCAASRGSGHYEFTLPENFHGQEVYVYGTFLSNNRQQACTSICFGLYSVPLP
ncbi:DUF6266 family protein [Pedobacter frigidisoli]|uniref:DUF6266 family protein n=1 Tax=Pedobacter frigidisoli TaxID=2530455 RepID=UPI00293167BD|nr:DUF6266 family protein [Pedobacter frigidisoli]